MELSSEARSLVEQLDQLPATQKKSAVKEVQRANPDLFPVGDEHRTKIWMTLLIGLMSLAAVAIVATVIMGLEGEDMSGLLAIPSAVVAGVIGLFAKSPTSG